MARLNSMATIDAALQGPLQTDTITGNGSSSVMAPRPAPGVDAPTPVTATQQVQPVTQNDILSLQQSDMQRQQKNDDLFKKSASQTVNAASSIIKGTGVRIESLPTPGSIVLPLVILIVFFLLLLPVNGHTRLVWIWLVLTGNADISNDGQGSGSSTPDTSTATNTSVPSATTATTGLAGATTFTVPFTMPTTMTGVEGS